MPGTFQRTILCPLVLLGILLFPHNLWALSYTCVPLDQIREQMRPPSAKESRINHVVFLGKLVKAVRQEQPAYKNLKVTVYTFKVIKAWKGLQGKTVSTLKIYKKERDYLPVCPTPIVAPAPYTNSLKPGRSYLVYAYYFKDSGISDLSLGSADPAQWTRVERMFLDAKKENRDMAGVTRQLPDLFRTSPSPETRYEAIRRLSWMPSFPAPEDRKQFFLEALIRTDENLKHLRGKPADGRTFKGLPGNQKFLEKTRRTILTLIALTLEQFAEDEEVLPPLIYLLQGKEPLVNIAAAVSLKKLGIQDPEIEKRIQTVLRYGWIHSSVEVHNFAVNAWWEIDNVLTTPAEKDAYRKLIDEAQSFDVYRAR